MLDRYLEKTSKTHHHLFVLHFGHRPTTNAHLDARTGLTFAGLNVTGLGTVAGIGANAGIGTIASIDTVVKVGTVADLGTVAGLCLGPVAGAGLGTVADVGAITDRLAWYSKRRRRC